MQRSGTKNTSYKHGMTGKHPLYYAWNNMKQRCSNPKFPQYKDYGGRGIAVCEKWKKNFISFYEFMISIGWQKGLTIDRINNDGNYEPSNVRIANKITQGRNQRVRKNSLSGVKGVTFCKQSKKWRSRITINKETIFLGQFTTIEKAKKARLNYIESNMLTDFIT